MIMDILDEKEIKSTNEILKKLEERSGKTINWHYIYHILMKLKENGEIERYKANAGFFWRKRKARE